MTQIQLSKQLKKDDLSSEDEEEDKDKRIDNNDTVDKLNVLSQKNKNIDKTKRINNNNSDIQHLNNQEGLKSYRTREQLFKELINEGIQIKSQNQKYLQSQKINTFKINKIQQSPNYEIVTMSVTLGWFTLQIKILNLKRILDVYSQSRPIYFNPSMGTSIYEFTYKEKQYVTKCLHFQEDSFKKKKNNVFQYESESKESEMDLNTNNFIFLQAIREYFFSKILSILKIGPKVTDFFGFNLVVSENWVQMHLQKCLPPNKQKIHQNSIEILKKNLYQMHELSIIHRDIKPGNIMYSRQFDKMVFIDFGISQISNKMPGQKQKTEFRGTYNYCSDEMKNLCHGRLVQVDLFYNDHFSFETSMKQLQSNQNLLSLSPQLPKINANLQEKVYLILKSKYFISKNTPFKVIQLFDAFLDQKIKEKLKEELLQFLSQVHPSQEIRSFYQDFFQKKLKEKREFQNLKIMYHEPVVMFPQLFLSGKWRVKRLQDFQYYTFCQLLYQKMRNFTHQNIKTFNYTKEKIKKQILLQQNILKSYSRIQYYSFLFKFISFRQINETHSIYDKIQVCKNYCKIHKIKIRQNQMDLKMISIVLEDMVEYYFNNIHFTDQIISIFQQLIIIGINLQKIQQKLFEFIQKIYQSYLTYEDKLFYFIKVIYIRKWLFYRSSRTIYYKYISINFQIQKNMSNLLDKKPEIRQIATFYLSFLKQLIYYQDINRINVLQDLAQKLKNLNIKKQQIQFLQQKLIYQIWIYNFQFGKNNFFSQDKHAQNFRNSIKKNQITLQFCELIRFYTVSKDNRKFQKIINVLQKAINCNKISRQFLIYQNTSNLSYLGKYEQLASIIQSYISGGYNQNGRFCYYELSIIISGLSFLQVFKYTHYNSEKTQEKLQRLKELDKQCKKLLFQKYIEYKKETPIIWRCSKIRLKLIMLKALTSSQFVCKNSYQLQFYTNYNKNFYNEFYLQEFNEIKQEDFFPYDLTVKFAKQSFNILINTNENTKNFQHAIQYVFVKNRQIVSNIDKCTLIQIENLSIIFYLYEEIKKRGRNQFYDLQIILREKIISQLDKYFYVEKAIHFIINSFASQSNKVQDLLNFMQGISLIASNRKSNYNTRAFVSYLDYLVQCVVQNKIQREVAKILQKKIFSILKNWKNPCFSFIYLNFYYFFKNMQQNKKILKLFTTNIDWFNFISIGKLIINSKIFYIHWKMLKYEQNYRKKMFLLKKHLKYDLNKNNLNDLMKTTCIQNNQQSIFYDKIKEKVIQFHKNCQNIKINEKKDRRTKFKKRNLFFQQEDEDYSFSGTYNDQNQ